MKAKLLGASDSCRTSCTIAKVALLSVSSRSDAASRLTCSISRRFFFIFSRWMSAALSASSAHEWQENGATRQRQEAHKNLCVPPRRSGSRSRESDFFVCLLFVFSVWQFGNYSVTSKSVSCQGQTFKCQTVFTWRYKFWFYRQQKLIIVIGDVNIINYMRIFFGRHSKNGTKNGRLTFSARVGFWLVGWFVGWCSNSRLLIFDIFCSRGVVIR